MASATSGIPPQHTLWRTHVCAPRHNLATFEGSSGSEAEEERNVRVSVTRVVGKGRKRAEGPSACLGRGGTAAASFHC